MAPLTKTKLIVPLQIWLVEITDTEIMVFQIHYFFKFNYA